MSVTPTFERALPEEKGDRGPDLTCVRTGDFEEYLLFQCCSLYTACHDAHIIRCLGRCAVEFGRRNRLPLMTVPLKAMPYRVHTAFNIAPPLPRI